MKTDVLVVGGGMGGALVARALSLRGVGVVVADADDRAGGVAASVRRDGYLLEPAAGTVAHPHPRLAPLLEGLPLTLRPARGAAVRYVRHRGETVPVRPGPGVVTSPLVGLSGKARALAEVAVPAGGDPDESLQSFFSRRFGGEVGRLAAWLAAAGVHAGDPEALSASAAFPQLVAAERSHGSVLRAMAASRRSGPSRPGPHVVDGGMAGIAEAVAADLGGGWLRSWRVERVDGAGLGWRAVGAGGETVDAARLVLAVAPAEAGRLLGGRGLGAETLEAAPVAVVWLGMVGPVLPDGLGTLVGPDEGFATLGFLYESSYAPERAPSGRSLVKAIVGGATRPDAVRLDDDALVAQVTGELEQVIGGRVDVEFGHVVRHHGGIPQYTAARSAFIRRLAEATPVAVDMAGWHVDGVGLSGLAAAAHTLAGKIEWELGDVARSRRSAPS